VGPMTDDHTKPEAPAPKPPRAPERRPLVLPPNAKDVTAQYAGKTFALIGAPKRWPSLPNMRDVTAARAGEVFAVIGAQPRRKA
jgi:hypothetical protein